MRKVAILGAVGGAAVALLYLARRAKAEEVPQYPPWVPQTGEILVEALADSQIATVDVVVDGQTLTTPGRVRLPVGTHTVRLPDTVQIDGETYTISEYQVEPYPTYPLEQFEAL